MLFVLAHAPHQAKKHVKNENQARTCTANLKCQRAFVDGFEVVETQQEEPSTPVITALCRYFECKPRQMRKKLMDPFNRWLAVQLLKTKKLRTTHLDEGRKFTLRFGMLTRKNSRQLMAYNGFLGITVQQHFYARHRIYLRYANLPCICMFGFNNRRTFLPLEVLSIL